MFYLYLLQSKKDRKLYIGFTNNLERRIKEHNTGLVNSTSARKPFELIYLEGYKAEEDARHRESNLKLKSRAFAQLKKRIMNSLSDNWCGGSIRTVTFVRSFHSLHKSRAH